MTNPYIRLTKPGPHINSDVAMLILFVRHIESITIGADYETTIRMASGRVHIVEEAASTVEDMIRVKP